MRIISRYIAKDITAAIGSVAAVLLLIILGKLLIQLLAEVLEGDLGVDMLGTVLLLGVIRYMVVLLPFSFFIAIIMVLTRMYRDSEANALKAGGASAIDFVRAVLTVGVPLIFILYFLVAYLSPWATRMVEVIENVTEQGLVYSQLTPGKFLELEHAGWVIYAESKDEESNDLQNVFVQRTEEGKVVVEVAKAARVVREDKHSQVLALQTGQRLEGVPGSGKYRLTRYGEHRVYPPRTDFSREANEPDYQPIGKLIGSTDSEYRAELLQRVSIIVSTVILMLMAVPLSAVSLNSGRFLRLALAVSIYIVYLNLVVVSCSWVKRGEEYGVMAVLVVHLLAAFAAFMAFQGQRMRRHV